jgi:arylformamidase
MGTTVNEEVRLTEGIARRRDVERRPVFVKCPSTLFVGGREPWHWIDQTYRYSHHLHRSEMNPEVHTLPRWGHFDILNEFIEAGSPILKATVARAKQA